MAYWIHAARAGLFAAGLMMVASLQAGGENRFSTVSVSRGRAVAMGGAYTSLTDDFSAGFYNPGAFRVNKTRNERSYRLFFNPLGMGTGLFDYSRHDRLMERDDKLTAAEGLEAMSLLFRGAVMTTPLLDAGISLGEEVFAGSADEMETSRFFSMREQSRGAMYAAFANVKIASTVSLGLTATVYRTHTDDKKTETGRGYTFGVLLNPNPKLNVGIAYHEIPDEMPDARFQLESIDNGTVTGGISYYPDDNTTFSIDIRNLNKDDLRAIREIHTGFERVMFGRIALRAGYFRKKETSHDVFSAGIGLLPVWERITKFRNSSRNDLITYTWLIEENGKQNQWHLFSLMFRY